MLRDVELLMAWRDGDEAAGVELFQRYFVPLRRFFRNKIDPDDVEDALQRVFLACVQASAGFRGDSSFRTWLFSIARHELYAYVRRRARDVVGAGLDLTLTSIAALGISPSSAIARDEEHALVLAALQRLSVEQQVMLELRYWEELSTDELAQVMDVAVATVRTRLFRARKALGEEIATLLGERSLDGVLTAASP